MTCLATHDKYPTPCDSSYHQIRLCERWPAHRRLSLTCITPEPVAESATTYIHEAAGLHEDDRHRIRN